MKNFYFTTIIILCSYCNTVTSQTVSDTLNTSNPDPTAGVYINLVTPYNNAMALVDGVGAFFKNCYSANVDQFDAWKFNNFGENISLVRDGIDLAIEFRPKPKLTDTLFLTMWNMRQQTYAIQTVPRYIHVSSADVVLIDNYLKTRTLLNMQDTSLYNFTVTASPDSYTNRFMIVFNRTRTTDNKPENNSADSKSYVSITPNPVVNNYCTVTMHQLLKGSYRMSINDMNGNVRLQKTIQYAGDVNEQVQFNNSWKNGIYIVHLYGANNTSYQSTFIINR